ncbi:MAG TPA: hypothetical protein VJX92_06000 [Methylomirabilota bacterium]|nr:hypothetical protein [Methylomirabilota bacterium]
MGNRGGRIGIAIGALLLASPVCASAGSAQAPLAVAVVVPARCAVRTTATAATIESRVSGAADEIAMRCTKGTLPGGATSARPGSFGPRISRDLVLTTASVAPAAPRPLSEPGVLNLAEPAGPRLVITVNF